MTRLASDGEPPIVSVDKFCDGSVSVVLDYLDGDPDYLGEYPSMDEAEKEHQIQFIYPITLKARGCTGEPSCNLVGHSPPAKLCPCCRQGYIRGK